MLRRIEKSEERLKIAAEGTREGLWTWDIKTNHCWFDARFKALLGYDENEAFSEDVSECESRIHPEDRARFMKLRAQHLENNGLFDCEHRLRTKSGEYRWFRTRGKAIRDASGQPTRMGGSIQDITDVKEAQEELTVMNKKLEKLSLQDSLTDIANRRMFDHLLAIEWGRAQRSQQPLSLLFIDIDFFKQYNDRYGHQAGDDCLKQVARALSFVVRRPADLVARYGGEEFVVLLPETDKEHAQRLAELCKSAVVEQGIPHETSEAGDVVTISVGVCTMQVTAEMQIEAFLEAADQAQYRAKQNGRNRVEVHPDS
jgi:diguanylate cyclase (GGDEF)-like protein/PAS domain S-box-containing protein